MKVLSIKTNAILDKDFRIELKEGRKFFLYVLFKADTMVLIEDEYVFAKKGTGILYDKNKVQSYYCCDSESFNHDFFMFDTESAFEEMIISDLPKGKLFSHAFPKKLSRALGDIEAETLSISKYQSEILSNCGMSFIYKLLSDIDFTLQSSNFKKHYHNFDKLRREIYRNPDKQYTVDNAADSLFLTRHYFMRLYKDFFGITFANDVINARIELAKRLLITSNMKVFEIAEKCGYENCEHFIRQFSKLTGETPHKYKNKQ